MARLAIMQPYLFPYMGYWQLMKAVDRFVIYDDVNYIKGGWINRNRILVNGEPAYFTIPLDQASPYDAITAVHMQTGYRLREKLKKSLTLTYARSPYFDEVWPTLARIINYDTDNLADFLVHQLVELARNLEITTEFQRSSVTTPKQALAGQARVIEICKLNGATHYINASGGRELYDGTTFRENGLDLRFLSCLMAPYPQRAQAFVPHLSIVDTLMALGFEGCAGQLDAYELLAPLPASIRHAA